MLSGCLSPKNIPYHTKTVFKSNETSAKISVLVTIFVTAQLIVAKSVRISLSYLSINFGMSPILGSYSFNLVFHYKEISAKISVLVTILGIIRLIESR